LTLEDGDIVMTGTPKGVGRITSGSKFEGKVIRNNTTLVSSLWLAK
jgi:2-keto-4-pentenoate hydratase/2-oxohepta-3-ene-1,7-dioic acid hydratase in catechol pathway